MNGSFPVHEARELDFTLAAVPRAGPSKGQDQPSREPEHANHPPSLRLSAYNKERVHEITSKWFLRVRERSDA